MIWSLFSSALLLLVTCCSSCIGHPASLGANVFYSSPENTWVVLVATSSGYINYRHQADLCHAYQVLKSHGIKDEKIIVMMVDDIANNWENKEKGSIINEVGGKDVYKGVPKHYTGDTVTSDTFIKILKGDTELVKSGKKVLNSTKDDNVFIYLVDHGLPGMISFPKDELYADQLVDTLHQLKKDDKFDKLVIYVEACYSGSMFNELLSRDSSILAVTSANADELSYSCCWDNKVKAFVADEFSSQWLIQAESIKNNSKVSIAQQITKLTDEVNMSHVSKYGDETITKLSVGEFQGNSVRSSITDPRDMDDNYRCGDRISSIDVPMETLKKLIEQETDSQRLLQLKNQLDDLLMKKQYASNLFKEFKSLLLHLSKPWTSNKVDFNCYRSLSQTINNNCVSISSYPHLVTDLKLIADFCRNELTEDELTLAQIIVEQFCLKIDNNILIGDKSSKK